MKIIVDTHKITLEKDEIVNAGEYNIQECNFEFSEEYEHLVKVALFSTETSSYQVNINNTNKCNIPIEVLEDENIITIGVYGYEVEDEELIKRYSPTPVYFKVESGSYKKGEDPEPPTPSVIEQIQQELERLGEECETNTEDIRDIETNKQDLLESGTNIKTINSQSLLGEGNINIGGGATYTAGDNITIENNVISATDTIYDDTEIKQDISNLQTNKADKTEIPDVSSFITKSVNDLTYYTLKTSTGSLIDLEINSSTFVVTAKLKDVDGNVISTDTIDLPLESVVVNGSYDSTNKKIVLTLQNGNTIDVPVGDLISGLQTEITSQNKLASDLIDDTNSGNKFVTTSEKSTWDAKSDFSGNYNDLSNKPTIPTTTSQLINNSDFTTKAYVDGLVGDINTVLATMTTTNGGGE